jgi:hypothetical protein
MKQDGKPTTGMVPSFFYEVRDDCLGLLKGGHITVAYILDAGGLLVRTLTPEDVS